MSDPNIPSIPAESWKALTDAITSFGTALAGPIQAFTHAFSPLMTRRFLSNATMRRINKDRALAEHRNRVAARKTLSRPSTTPADRPRLPSVPAFASNRSPLPEFAESAEFADFLPVAERGYWNGLPTRCIRGTAIVADDGRFPEYWARHLVGQRVAVVQVDLDGVNYGGGLAWLDNRKGEGWAKVQGGGGPGSGHRNFDIAPGSFIKADS